MIRFAFILFMVFSAFFTWGCKDGEVDGGYTMISVSTDEVVKSLDYIKKELAAKHPDVKIVKAVSAQSQIVAGQKLVIKCEYLSDTNKEPKVLKAFMFITLEDKYVVEKIEF